MKTVLQDYKKTPVPNRGFVPGHLKPYSFLGQDVANIQYYFLLIL